MSDSTMFYMYPVSVFIAYYVIWVISDRSFRDAPTAVICFISSMFWPIVFTVIGIVGIAKFIGKSLSNIDYTINKMFKAIEFLPRKAFSKIPFDKIENKLHKYKTRGYKPYVQTNDNIGRRL